MDIAPSHRRKRTRAEGRIVLHLDISEEMRADLERLKAYRGGTYTAIVRDALSIYIRYHLPPKPCNHEQVA